MTSGNIRMGPDPDSVLEALREAIRDDPALRDRSAEKIADGLARDGYLQERPDPVLVGEMLGALGSEDPGAEPGEETEEASPT